MTEIIVHHYDVSPFSEKVRLMLGIKGLAWRSVIQPVIMPKPDLVPLTGGYRRIPVMQIGADVYCDSQVILEELELRHPDPPVVRGADWAVNLFADRLWFQASVAVIFGKIGRNVPKEFIVDREKLSGRPFDVQALQAAAPFAREQWRAFAAWIEQGLGGAEFLGGDRPSLSDVAAWMPVWWAGGAVPELLDGLPNVSAWRDRIRGIGHGQRTEGVASDGFEAARAAEPVPASVGGDAFKAGDRVVVQADDYGRDPIEGRLVGLTPTRISVAREAGELGMIHVHFPRAGYVLARA